MLDTLADKEPKLSPKPGAQTGGTDGPALHPTREDLKAYAYGRLASARLDYCQAHLDTCEDCRTELEDIRTCSNEMPSLARPEVPSARSLRRKRNPVGPLVGSAAVLVAVAVATVLWHGSSPAGKAAPVVAVTGPPRVESVVAVPQGAVPTPPTPQSATALATGAPPRVVQPPAAQGGIAPPAAAQGGVALPPAAQGPRADGAAAASPTTHGAIAQGAVAAPTAEQGAFARIAAVFSRITHWSVAPTNAARAVGTQASAANAAAAAPPAIGTSPATPQLADEIAALPDDVRSAVSATIQHGKLQFPTNVGHTRRHASSAAGVSAANTGFALLGPFGEATSDTRPEFSWQALPGATHYSIAIVDAALHPVQHSGKLRKTVWRPKRPLHPGRTYLWQVTATLPGGSRVVASDPAPSEAVLRIVPVKLTDEMARFRKDHQDSHLVLGALYAQAGMLSESEDELRKVPPGDSSYKTARTLLESLSSTGPSAQ